MRIRRRLRSFACAAFVLAPCTSVALAQEMRGPITGTATDSTGVVVAGAAIKLVNTGTDMLFTAETNSAGQYRFLFLSPGAYKLGAAVFGFKTFDRHNIVLDVAQSAGIGIVLQVGAQNETADALSGNSIASMLLGYPSSGQIDNNIYPYWRTLYYAPRV